MNKDKVFLKTKYDGLWESNPHLAFLPCMFGGIIGLFVFLFLGIITDSFISVLCYILGIIFLVVIGILLPVKKNNENNISKSIAFIKRDNKWYAIKLMYDYADAGLTFYAPSGSILQGATLPHNISVAIKTQGQEKYIKKLREVEKNYSDALDGILESLKDDNYSKPIYAGVDQKIDYFLNKYCFNEIYISKKKLCGYIILNNPKIDNIDNKYITITFTDENGNQKTMKFRNSYDGLVDELKKEMR